MRDHGGVDPNAITTEGWLKQWLDERVSDRAIGRPAAYNYAKIIKNHLVPAIGSVRLQDLQGTNIRKLKSELLQSRRPGTVRKILGLLRQALNSAVTQKLIASNPASDVPMPSQKHGKKGTPRAQRERDREIAPGRKKYPVRHGDRLRARYRCAAGRSARRRAPC